jgi:hypothetical protein
VQSRCGFLQGYTAQAVATREQIVICADVIAGGQERITLEPLIDQSHDELERAGVSDRVEVALVDAVLEYRADRAARRWRDPSTGQTRCRASQVTWQDPAAEVTLRGDARTTSHEEGKQLYRQRQAIIEPVFAQTKHNRRVDRFQRRGLGACRAEWRPITATHNLLKLWRHGPAPVPG